MSTRAIYTFRDRDGEEHHVYKHSDGAPKRAVTFIAMAFNSGLAFPLPRFEANEAAAAFVATHKTGPGDVRLCDRPERHPDIEYHYAITLGDDGRIHVKIETAGSLSGQERVLFSGRLERALAEYR